MNENQLLEQKELREELIGRIEVLDKVKELILLPYGDSMTMDMVADYYEVGREAINSLVKDNRDEISEDGYTILESEQLKSFKNFCQIKSRARSIAVFPRRAILRVGMLLRDSEIAKQVRTTLLNMADNKNTIQEETTKIDKNKELMLEVIFAKTDNERLIALNNLNRYQEEEKERIESEKKVAVEKVENLTKSDATFGLREAKANLGVSEGALKKYILDNKYCYRNPSKEDKNGKMKVGRIKAYAQYTEEPTRYFTEIKEVDRLGVSHSKMVFTIKGIEFFRQNKNEIQKGVNK